MSDICAVAHLDQWFDDPRTSDWHLRETQSPATVIYFEAAESLQQSIEPEFAYHAAKWATETTHLSSIQQAMNHPSYKRIMAMADRDRARVLALILRELQVRPAHWFHALASITGENPVKPRDAGRFDKMVQAWLDWGRKRRLVQ